jgi:hypothetical protein
MGSVGLTPWSLPPGHPISPGHVVARKGPAGALVARFFYPALYCVGIIQGPQGRTARYPLIVEAAATLRDWLGYRQSDGRSKRTCDLTSSIVPRGTSFHRWVELAQSGRARATGQCLLLTVRST